MSKKTTNLVPIIKAAEEFGVNRQTISNWHDAGILQGTVIKGNRFVTRESLDKLKEVYPESAADAGRIEAYRTEILSLEDELKKKRKALRTERIYRNYAPRYVRNFVDNAVELMKRLDGKEFHDLLDEKFIRCWLFGYDINETCEEQGVSYYTYIASAKRYIRAMRKMVEYTELVERNRSLEEEVEETKAKLQHLQTDMDEYRERFKNVDEEQSLKEQYPVLNMPLIELDFTVRTLNVLKMHGFETLGQVIRYDKFQLMKMRHFGRKSLNEIIDFLEQYGLELGTDITAPRKQ